jgi:hypothetical protein
LSAVRTGGRAVNDFIGNAHEGIDVFDLAANTLWQQIGGPAERGRILRNDHTGRLVGSLVVEVYASRGFLGFGLALLHPSSLSLARICSSVCLNSRSQQSPKIGVAMEDKAPSTLEVIGAAFLAMSVPIFVIAGAVGYILLSGK